MTYPREERIINHCGVKSSYIYFRNGNEEVVKTIAVTDSLNVDIDSEGNIIGIENTDGPILKNHLYQILSQIKVGV